jgi:iron complex transport system ATP-binding protein
VFKNVKFSFLKDQNVGEEDLVLRGMNFKIEKNQINLIIGPNGSGKSTILQLIARLYDIFDGEILI